MDTEVTPNKTGAARSLLDLSPEQLEARVTAWDEPRYRSKQILDWVYRRGASTYAEMSNLPIRLRTRLEGHLPIYESTIARDLVSRDQTRKLLLRWSDGATTECVLLADRDRRTACISTQVGCPVRCVFCASGLDGLQRQLSRGQIVEQVLRIRRLCTDDCRLSNVVFMGLGEPLANYAATVGAAQTINAPWGIGIGARKITISTVGVAANMRRLANEGLQVTLALSLHAPTDELRKRIIPWAQGMSVKSLVDACCYYFERTGREVTIEYVLLAGINDDVAQARALADVSGRMRANVNLIAYNPVDGLPYQRPDDETVRRFLETLESAGVNTHLRRSRGLDIEAACGQLRRRDSRIHGPAST